MRRIPVITLLLLASVSFASPAVAQDPPASHKRKPVDPNEMVCQRETILGSRLATRRVCMTRAQWAERRRNDRELVARTQEQLCVAKGGKCMQGD